MKEIFILIVGLSLGWFIGLDSASEHYRKQAVDRGHAEYNPTNGGFRWKEPK